MLLGLFEPGLKLSRGRSAGPVLIPILRRRVHDPGDVARAGKDKPDWTGKELSTQDHRARRCDMVLPGRQVIDWDFIFEKSRVTPPISMRPCERSLFR